MSPHPITKFKDDEAPPLQLPLSAFGHHSMIYIHNLIQFNERSHLHNINLKRSRE